MALHRHQQVVRKLQRKIVESGMTGKVTSGGSPQPDTVKIITEKQMKSGNRGT